MARLGSRLWSISAVFRRPRPWSSLLPLTLSTMISNDVVMPVWLTREGQKIPQPHRFSRRLIRVRRYAIVSVLVLGWACYHLWFARFFKLSQYWPVGVLRRVTAAAGNYWRHVLAPRSCSGRLLGLNRRYGHLADCDSAAADTVSARASRHHYHSRHADCDGGQTFPVPASFSFLWVRGFWPKPKPPHFYTPPEPYTTLSPPPPPTPPAPLVLWLWWWAVLPPPRCRRPTLHPPPPPPPYRHRRGGF